MKVHFTKRFKRKYKKLDAPYQKIIDDTLTLLLRDFTASSLRNKKVQGHPRIREISGNMDIRITFEIAKPDTIVLRNCGHHDDVL